MGLCIDTEDTRHGISFEVRAESVVFNDDDIYPDGWAEIDKRLLRRMAALLTDPEWTDRLGTANTAISAAKRADDGAVGSEA